jgi:TctA family transporter
MKFEKYLGILLSILFLFPLYLTRSPNYFFFDTFVELFSIVVAYCTFI